MMIHRGLDLFLVSWFVALSTLVYIVGDILASRFSLSPIQGWCQRSYWSNKKEYEGFEKHKNELAKLNGHKAMIERQGVAKPSAALNDLSERLRAAYQRGEEFVEMGDIEKRFGVAVPAASQQTYPSFPFRANVSSA